LERLEASWREVMVGLHRGAEVALGFDWDGVVETPRPEISQVLTSTIAGGFYGAKEALGAEVFHRFSRTLLRAAYVGTLAAAVVDESDWVVLTLIGGGAFENAKRHIWQSILEALDRIEPLLTKSLHVVLNGRDLTAYLNLEEALLPEVVKRSGRLCSFDSDGLVKIRS
jgi:hypothetical protein